MPEKRKVEVLQLVFERNFSLSVVGGQACMVENHVVVKYFVDKECLSYTATTINGNKLRSTAMIIAMEFSDFFFSS